MDAKINNVIYMELYSGPKMMEDEYLKSNIARSIDRDSTVVRMFFLVVFFTKENCLNVCNHIYPSCKAHVLYYRL
jgi:hypothetical protein